MPATTPNSVTDFLFNEIAWLYGDWFAFKQLFGCNEDRVNRLNRRTGAVFGRVQYVLLDHILLEIARLLDRHEVTKKRTATLDGALHELAIPKTDPRLSVLRDEFVKLKAICAPIIQQRHRRIAHLDRAVAMGDEVLPGVSRSDIGDAIAGIAAFFNRIILLEKDAEASFDRPPPETGVEMLLKVLEAGNDVLDKRRAEIKALRKEVRRGEIEIGPEVFRALAEKI
jgi:hypothetical protein